MATDQYGLLAPGSFYSWAEYADYLWKHIERGHESDRRAEAAAIRLWREHEWASIHSIAGQHIYYCCVCGNAREQGHAEGCELAALLKSPDDEREAASS